MRSNLHRSRRPRLRRGVSIVWTLVSLGMVMGVVTVGVESAHIFFASQQLQNSADAAALAAARLVTQDPAMARAAAIDVAQANRVSNGPVLLADNPDNLVDGDIVLGVFDRATNTFAPTLNGPNAVLVRARRTADSAGGPVPLLFAANFGIDGIDAVRSTIAMFSGGDHGAGLLTLGPTGCGAQLTGNARITVNDGAVHVNSAANCSLCMTGNARVTAGTVNVGGDVCGSPNSNVVGTLNTYAAPSPDPLAFLPEPTIGLPMNPPGISASANNTVNLQPGYYPDGITVSGNAVVNMAPGIYIIGGSGGGQYPPGIKTSGNGRINADGVMLYLESGSMDISGNGAVNISPPDPTVHNFPGVDTYAGISVFQARDNTRRARMVGNAGLSIGGTLYLPNAPLELRGNGNGYGHQIIAESVELVGNANITINYNGAFPTAGGTTFIVR